MTCWMPWNKHKRSLHISFWENQEQALKDSLGTKAKIISTAPQISAQVLLDRDLWTTYESPEQAIIWAKDVPPKLRMMTICAIHLSKDPIWCWMTCTIPVRQKMNLYQHSMPNDYKTFQMTRMCFCIFMLETSSTSWYWLTLFRTPSALYLCNATYALNVKVKLLKAGTSWCKVLYALWLKRG